MKYSIKNLQQSSLKVLTADKNDKINRKNDKENLLKSTIVKQAILAREKID